MARQKRKGVPSEPRDLGTPETRRKHKKGTVEVLLARGRIDGPMLQAADEILWVFSKLTKPVTASVMNLDRVDGSRSEMTETEFFAMAHKDRFTPWMNKYSKRGRRGGPSISSIVLTVLQGETAASIDDAEGWRKGSAANLLIEGLDGYAKMFGLVRR